MALMFPNTSRSYDATRRAVRFWGHESAMEWSFFVTEDALKSMHPAMAQGESGMLGAFDAHRERIWAAASKAFARGRRGSYELGAADI
jgi:hypothetical protein